MNFKTLSEIVQDIRVGMSAAEIDRFAEISDGWLSSQTLDPKGNWDDRLRRPCTLWFDENRCVSSIHFLTVPENPIGLTAELSVVDARRDHPEYAEVFVDNLARECGEQRLVLAKLKGDVSLVGIFANERLKRISYFSSEGLKEYEQGSRKRDAEELRAATQRELEKKATSEKRQSYLEWRRSAPSDDVLREWAKNYASRSNEGSEWIKCVEWLIVDSTPIERHSLMETYNWNNGIEIPRWIIQQADTQLATVLEILWNASPFYYARTLAEDEEIPDYLVESYEMICEISDLVRTNTFAEPSPNSCIRFVPPSRDRQQGYNAQTIAFADRLIPPKAYQPILGQMVPPYTYESQLPFSIKILG